MNSVRLGLFGLALLALAGGGYYLWKHGVALPETISQPVFVPLSGAVADQAVLEVQKFVPGDISTTLPVSTSAADIPFYQLAVESNEHNHEMEAGDTDIALVDIKPIKARLYRFENEQICYDELCPMGLYPLLENGTLDYEHPIFIMAAKNIEISSKLTNGNPELIVDYGSRGGKHRFVWDVSGMFPTYQDMGTL